MLSIRPEQQAKIITLLGRKKPAKDNFLSITYSTTPKHPYTVRLCRKGKLTAGYSGESLDEAVGFMLDDLLDEEGN